MKVMLYHTCLLDESLADLYIHYCETHDIKHVISCNSEHKQVHLELWGTQEELGLLKRWILRTLYYQEAQHGENNK